MNWTLIVTMIASGAAAAVAWIYYHQLKAMTKARQLESILIILRYIDDIELLRVRYFVYEHAERLKALFDVPYTWENRKIIDEEVRKMSDGKVELHKIDLWINALNNICFLVREEYAPPKVVSDFMKNTLLHCWYAFAPYIEHRRSREDDIGEPSMYAKHLEWVVRNKCTVNASYK